MYVFSINFNNKINKNPEPNNIKVQTPTNEPVNHYFAPLLLLIASLKYVNANVLKKIVAIKKLQHAFFINLFYYVTNKKKKHGIITLIPNIL